MTLSFPACVHCRAPLHLDGRNWYYHRASAAHGFDVHAHIECVSQPSAAVTDTFLASLDARALR